ncbi:MAG: hypothetical protein GX974_09830 [Clostridiales bacterium]|nr:hypothetical protein [Clostridiales bacterium]
MKSQYMLKSLSGAKWYIHLDKDMKLVYSKKEGQSWSNILPIDKYSVRDFSSTIDTKDRLHIVTYNENDQLIYYQWNGDKWLYSTITNLRSQFQDVPFLQIISYEGNINIFYYITNSMGEGNLYHHFGDGFHWRGGKIFSFEEEENISVVDVNSNYRPNMYIYISKNKSTHTSIERSQFDRGKLKWTDFSPSLGSPLRLTDIRIDLDDNGIEHLIGTQHSEEDVYTLYYLSKGTEPIKIVSQSQPFDPSLMITASDGVYAAWALGDRIFTYKLNEENMAFDSLGETSREDMSIINHVYINDDNITCIIRSWDKSPLQTEATPATPPSTAQDKHQDREMREFKNSLTFLKNQAASVSKQIDDLYSLFYNLKDYLVKYEKSLYQVQLSLQRHDNEIAQLQRAPSTFKTSSPKKSTTVPEPSSIVIENADDNKDDTPSEVVNLGDVQVIIDNAEDETSDS